MRNVKFYILTLYRVDGTNEVFEVTEWPKREEIPPWCVRMDIALPESDKPDQFYLLHHPGNGIDPESWEVFERGLETDQRMCLVYDKVAVDKLLDLLNG
jgi:hypothetical protein